MLTIEHSRAPHNHNLKFILCKHRVNGSTTPKKRRKTATNQHYPNRAEGESFWMVLPFSFSSSSSSPLQEALISILGCRCRFLTVSGSVAFSFSSCLVLCCLLVPFGSLPFGWRCTNQREEERQRHSKKRREATPLNFGKKLTSF